MIFLFLNYLQRIKRNSSCIWRWASPPEFLWCWRCWLPGCGGRNDAEDEKPNRFIHLIPSRPLLTTLATLIMTLIWLVYRCHLLRRSFPNSPAWTERWPADLCPVPKVFTRPSMATPASTVSLVRYAVPLSKKVIRTPVVSSETGTTVTTITARQHFGCFIIARFFFFKKQNYIDDVLTTVGIVLKCTYKRL